MSSGSRQPCACLMLPTGLSGVLHLTRDCGGTFAGAEEVRAPGQLPHRGREGASRPKGHMGPPIDLQLGGPQISGEPSEGWTLPIVPGATPQVSPAVVAQLRKGQSGRASCMRGLGLGIFPSQVEHLLCGQCGQVTEGSRQGWGAGIRFLRVKQAEADAWAGSRWRRRHRSSVGRRRHREATQDGPEIQAGSAVV